MTELKEELKEELTLNEKYITPQELEEKKKRKDIKIIQEGPNSYRQLQRLQE